MLSTYSESLVQAFLFQQSCILHRDMHNPYNSMLNLQQNIINLACSGHWCQVSRLFVLLFILIFHHFVFWMLLNAAWKLGVLVSRKGVGEWRPQWMEGEHGKYHLVCQKPTHFDSWTVGERIIGVLHLILHKYIYVTIPLVALCLQRCVNLLFQSVFFYLSAIANCSSSCYRGNIDVPPPWAFLLFIHHPTLLHNLKHTVFLVLVGWVLYLSPAGPAKCFKHFLIFGLWVSAGFCNEWFDWKMQHEDVPLGHLSPLWPSVTHSH